jgi:Cu+-exporting ATPase
MTTTDPDRKHLPAGVAAASTDSTTTFAVGGMHCASCETLLTDVLCDVPGVQRATVSKAAGSATVQHDARVSAQQLREAIEAEGYTAVPQ